MEFVLKDCKCEHCQANGLDGSILVLNYENFVDYGVCVSCLQSYILPQENYKNFITKNCVVYNPKKNNKKVLECSSDEDKRFNDLFAKVVVNGVVDSIKNHYENAKVFRDCDFNYVAYNDLKKAEGKTPVGFKINGYILPLSFGERYYKLLWYKYLKTNKYLEEVLSKYDDYNDMSQNKTSSICQSDIIREYMQNSKGIKYKSKDRGKNLYSDCKELLDFLNRKVSYVVEKGDIFKGLGQIIGHQANCQGAMGAGIAKTIKDLYKKVYDEYVLFCKKTPKKELLGKCQIIDNGSVYIANLFGQFYYGGSKYIEYTDKDALKKALIELKNFAKKKNLVVSLPYGISCGKAHSNWDEISKIIDEVFKDYYVLLYDYN